MIKLIRQERLGFSEVGVTCQNFETVCDMAGVQPDKTRSFAYKVIHSDNKKYLKTELEAY